MNKTASLAIRIVAILAAAGAGYFWYSVQSQGLDVAMEKTKWFQTDPELRSGPEFSQRMEAAGKLQGILAEKRKTLEEVSAAKSAAEQMVSARDAKISELNDEKNRLEGDRIEALRKRDELVKSTRDAENKAAHAEGELESATAQIAKLNAQIGGMKTQEECDALVAKTNAAVDEKERAFGSYAQLRNWVVRQGLVPPFGATPGETISTADSQGVNIVPEKIQTRVVSVDRKNGLVAVTLGTNDKIESDKTYVVERDGAVLGSVGVSNIGENGLTVLSILPGTNQALFNREMIISLVPAAELPAARTTSAKPPVAVAPVVAK